MYQRLQFALLDQILDVRAVRHRRGPHLLVQRWVVPLVVHPDDGYVVAIRVRGCVHGDRGHAPIVAQVDEAFGGLQHGAVFLHHFDEELQCAQH